MAVCISTTISRKISVGEKLANSVNHELFAKIFLVNIHRYTKIYSTYAMTLAYSPKFSSQLHFPVWFDPPKSSHVRYYAYSHVCVKLGVLQNLVFSYRVALMMSNMLSA